jgi:hypothetical protein
MIRGRIIEYLTSKGLSKYQFYKSTGLSNGFLDKEGSIGTDSCEKISYVYPDLNILWLITGKGEMINPETAKNDDLGSVLKKNNGLLSGSVTIQLTITDPFKVKEILKIFGNGF